MSPAARAPAIEHITHEGQPAVRLSLPDGSHATVLLHGAHVVSWHAAKRGEQLYLSPLANLPELQPGQAVRGGVPVIFPQFNQRGPDTNAPRHGFARHRAWQVESTNASQTHALVTLALDDDAETRALWPHAFTLELTVSLAAERLDIELYVLNPEDSPQADTWSFTGALHTYLAVSELPQIRLQGLDGCRFEDAITGGEHIEDHPEKRFSGEIDRIYTSVPGSLLLRDGTRQLTLERSSFEDVVVWNPGPDQCARLKDMPDDDWERMLCIEAVQLMNPPTLAPGESWTGRQGLVLPDQSA